ncbi:putative glutathione-specific gamma-glutamylcyclotransferase 2 [Artemia franciscana]|uniref:putative glutathione-specific gamma-glutamylcyclotransferase 2 n=1 Tax=Artemia franciscana TaxID=6661 RepID=UPI0032DA61BA
MWIFGYGSLVWKVDFSYKRKITGYIKGFSRRFWQASIDHRGVPENPGRVVTLVPSDNLEDKVWGVAYEITDDRDIEKLNHREKRYELAQEVLFTSLCGTIQLNVNLFVGNCNGPLFLGPASVEVIASQVVKAHGPSGTNVEYVLRLAEFMRTCCPGEEDEHLFEVETLIVKMVSNNKPSPSESEGFVRKFQF